MNKKILRLIILLSLLLIVSITIAQFSFLRAAYKFQEQLNDQNIKAALGRTWRQLITASEDNKTQPPVKQLSEKYFVVNLNQPIEEERLKAILKEEFSRLSIFTDFQFAIYNPITKKLVLGKYIDEDGTDLKAKPVAHLPNYSYNNYYFCVYFPFKAWNVIRSMGLWIFFGLLLVCSIIFFCYAIYFIIKQSRLSKIQKDFINAMTHEFQTPISTIIISAEALKNPKMIETRERVLKHAGIIEEEVLRLKTQVETILQVERIDKKTSFTKQVIDVHDMILRATDKLDLVYATKEKIVSYDFASNPSLIYADSLHIYNVIYNILDNAIKYSEGVPEIFISTFLEKNNIVVSIKDKGVGIEQAELRKIFHKFYRISDLKPDTSKGFGIGLYYVKTIIKAHSGIITVTSEPGKGSIFSIHLPLSTI